MQDGGRPLWWKISGAVGLLGQLVLVVIDLINAGGDAPRSLGMRIVGFVASLLALYFWITLLVVDLRRRRR